VVLGLQSVSMHGFIKGNFINLINNICYYLQDGLIFSSLSVKNSLKNKISNKGVVIYNHVSKPSISISSENYIITVCRLSPEKNLIELIDFFMCTDTDIHLYIVGDGPELERLKKRSKGKESIKFLGFRDDIESLISKSMFYISTSKVEGLPMSILTALSLEKPLLLSNIGPHRELINGNGHTYDLGDIRDFKNKFNLMKKNINDYSNHSSKLFNEKFNKLTLTLLYKNYINKL